MPLKDAIEFAYEDTSTAGVTNWASWEAEEVVEAHEQASDDMEGEDGADVQGIRKASSLLRLPNSEFSFFISTFCFTLLLVD